MSGPVDFTAQYRAIFDRFGYPLTERHGIDETTLDRAAVRLDCKIPEALRAYYVVAGNEKRFNQALQRILPPSGWSVAGKHHAFVEENQAVCQWGVSLRSKGAGDPVISQGFEEETDEGESSFAWHSENARCSKFIIDARGPGRSASRSGEPTGSAKADKRGVRRANGTWLVCSGPFGFCGDWRHLGVSIRGCALPGDLTGVA